MFIPRGSSRMPSANARRHSGRPRFVEVVDDQHRARGKSAKNSRRNRRVNPERSLAYSGPSSGRRPRPSRAVRAVRPRPSANSERTSPDRRRPGRPGTTRPGVCAPRHSSDQRRLAGARRPRDPQKRMGATLVQQPEQPLTLVDVVEARPAELREGRSGRGPGVRISESARRRGIGRTAWRRAPCDAARASARAAIVATSSRSAAGRQPTPAVRLRRAHRSRRCPRRVAPRIRERQAAPVPRRRRAGRRAAPAPRRSCSTNHGSVRASSFKRAAEFGITVSRTNSFQRVRVREERRH